MRMPALVIIGSAAAGTVYAARYFGRSETPSAREGTAAPPVEHRPERRCPTERAAEDRSKALLSRERRARARLDQLQGWREALEGASDRAPLDPIDVAALYDDLEAASLAAVPGQRTELVDLDCTQPPCMALFSVSQDVGDSHNPALPLQAWLGEQTGWEHRKLYTMALPDRATGRVLVSLAIWEHRPTPEAQGVALGRQKDTIRRHKAQDGPR